MIRDILEFALPPELEASEPPEAHGISRDHVRLMVSYYGTDRIVHTRFDDLPNFLDPGDVLVINTSGTMNAALNATRDDRTQIELHLSTHLSGDAWIVELRLPSEQTTKPFYNARPGEILALPAGASITLNSPYRHQRVDYAPDRLWWATLSLPIALDEYLARYGFPIRYCYVPKKWTLDYYQTAYATLVGSAEMPSAGRPFTPELITRLVARGIQIVPLILHTGVASLEKNEPPYDEYYHVPIETARLVNSAKAEGKRVVAVGTTVMRALETVADAEGIVWAGEGWTDLIVTPQRGVRIANGMLTGFHEPRASHLAMLAALAGHEHIRLAYAEALREKYLWHEFGDSHLILAR